MKFHIAQSGRDAGAAVPCHAKIRCKLTDENGEKVQHARFNSRDEAQAWAESQASKKYPKTPKFNKKTNTTLPPNQPMHQFANTPTQNTNTDFNSELPEIDEIRDNVSNDKQQLLETTKNAIATGALHYKIDLENDTYGLNHKAARINALESNSKFLQQKINDEHQAFMRVHDQLPVEINETKGDVPPKIYKDIIEHKGNYEFYKEELHRRQEYEKIYSENFGERYGQSERQVNDMLASKRHVESITFSQVDRSFDFQQIYKAKRQDHESMMAGMLGYKKILSDNPNQDLSDFTENEKDDAFKNGFKLIKETPRPSNAKAAMYQRIAHGEQIIMQTYRHIPKYKNKAEQYANTRKSLLKLSTSRFERSQNNKYDDQEYIFNDS